jgi:hypothetical protein
VGAAGQGDVPVPGVVAADLVVVEADLDWDDAHLINAAYDIHRDDPAFGYRFVAGELRERGPTRRENRVARRALSSRSGPSSRRSGA